MWLRVELVVWFIFVVFIKILFILWCRIIYTDIIIIVFLGLHPQQMEVPRLGVELERQLLAYATATATLDLSHVFSLYHSLQRYWILKPLSEARDWTLIFMDTSWVCNLLSHNRNSWSCILKKMLWKTNKMFGVPAVAQQVKDPVLSLQRYRFDTLPGVVY